MTTRHNGAKKQRDNGVAVFRWAAVVALAGTVLMVAALTFWVSEGGVRAPTQPQIH